MLGAIRNAVNQNPVVQKAVLYTTAVCICASATKGNAAEFASQHNHETAGIHTQAELPSTNEAIQGFSKNLSFQSTHFQRFLDKEENEINEFSEEESKEPPTDDLFSGSELNTSEAGIEPTGLDVELENKKGGYGLNIASKLVEATKSTVNNFKLGKLGTLAIGWLAKGVENSIESEIHDKNMEKYSNGIDQNLVEEMADKASGKELNSGFITKDVKGFILGSDFTNIKATKLFDGAGVQAYADKDTVGVTAVQSDTIDIDIGNIKLTGVTFAGGGEMDHSTGELKAVGGIKGNWDIGGGGRN